MMDNFIKPKKNNLSKIFDLITIAIISISVLYIFYQNKIIQKANQALESLASTTISTNISTDGTLSVGGSATTSGSFYIANDLTVENGNVGIGTTTSGAKLEIGGGTTGASPSAVITLSDYYDDSGDPSLSHINLGYGIYGFGVSNNALNYISGAVHNFYNDTLLSSPAVSINADGGTTGASPSAVIGLKNYYDDSGNPSLSHINLGYGIYGFGISNNTLNYISGAVHNFYSDTTLSSPTMSINADDGNVGIGTATLNARLSVYDSSATTTINVDSGSASKGSCLKLKDNDGSGYTYCSVNSGTMTCSTDSCE